jgi:predicted acetyltransferase
LERCVTTDPYRLRTLDTADDYALVSDVLGAGFGDDMSEDDKDSDRLTFEPARDHVVEHAADGIVANAAAYTRELTIPGAVLPSAAHVTLVAVRPTHRRRGLLTRLMLHQLKDIREVRREPVALLWASEGRIYQRFGYGAAAARHWIEADNRNLRFTRSVTPEVGRVRDAAPGDVRKELRDVFERVRPGRPGWSGRTDNWWSRRLLDPASSRHGYTARRALLFDGPDGVDGYALWRRKGDWDMTGPKGLVDVVELIAATPEAYAALWRLLFSVDLTRTVRYGFAAVDEPLRHLVDEPRALNATALDSLWLRIVDLPAALAARRYAAPVNVVIEVTDGLLPDNAGRWRLSGDASGATCARTSDAPDLTCDITDLGAVYLGGTPLGSLAAAGRVRETRPGALPVTATAFSWQPAPSALEVF